VERMKELVDYGVMAVLAVMSFVAFAVAFERFIVLLRTKPERFKSRALLEKHLTKRLYVIATVASVAPYVGLLGTVIGILMTFYAIGQKGFVDTKEIMVGLALALKATAAGLLVAIPAVMLYNYLSRKVKEKLLDFEAQHGREGV